MSKILNGVFFASGIIAFIGLGGQSANAQEKSEKERPRREEVKEKIEKAKRGSMEDLEHRIQEHAKECKCGDSTRPCDDWKKRREHRKDLREDRRDKREDLRDKREDIRDRREDRRDAVHDGGANDKLEDLKDRAEDVRDRRKDRADGREDARKKNREGNGPRGEIGKRKDGVGGTSENAPPRGHSTPSRATKQRRHGR